MGEVMGQQVVSEAYRVNNGCTLSPAGAPTKITMPVTSVNNATSPVTKIVARQGSLASWEREATPRYADIYFNANQFTLLKTTVNTTQRIYVTYDSRIIAGDDEISNQKVTFNFP
jgi:hypothetical protein